MAAPYVVQLTVPANTPTSNPVRKQILPAAGIVARVQIRFPDKCYGAVGVRLLDRDSQYAPVESGWIHANAGTVEWTDERRLSGPPFALNVEGYSLASDYPHTIEVRVDCVQRTLEMLLEGLTEVMRGPQTNRPR